MVQSFYTWKSELEHQSLKEVKDCLAGLQEASKRTPTALELASQIYVAMGIEIMRRLPDARKTNDKKAAEQLQAFMTFVSSELKLKKDSDYIPKELASKVDKAVKDMGGV